ncbi:MAG TPA: hypothetical protein PLZ37_15200, partial [Nitrospira sp.]|nr:hypothetical protein [Nitrospira sp.]
KFTLLLRQGGDIDLLLRLMAKELRLNDHGEDVAYRNNPTDKSGYEMFRKVVLHISAIQDANRLYAESMLFERTWTIPADSVTAEGFKALEQDYLVAYDPQHKTYRLRKPVSGRILITNYDPNTLPPEERVRLHEEAERRPMNDVSFDIRPGHYGGEWPLRGEFRLRSFNTMLNFLAQAVEEEPEYAVEKDSRTPPFMDNPVRTMDLLVQDASPSESDLTVRSHDKYYSVNISGPLARWNREAFKLLYQLFQMTVTEVSRSGVPSITIAK